MFLVFEGLDGSGSTTQAKILQESLQKDGKSVLHTSEPTNNLVGGLIRGALTNQWKTSPEGLQLLFSADRAHHLTFEIEPALEEGKIVISDRYYWSTIAYGSISVDFEWLREMNKHFRKPDFIFYLSVPTKVCLERIEKRGNEKELFEKEKILQKVDEAYHHLAEIEENALILDGERNKEDIADEVLHVLRKRFPNTFY